MVEGMRLFAERGFRATSVGDIEEAAGLKPRRGGLYKHFPSKHDLLVEAVRSHIDAASVVARRLDDLGVGSTPSLDRDRLADLMVVVGRQFLDEMDRMEDLTRILEHDGARVAELTAEVKSDVVDLSYRVAADIISTVAPETPDPQAHAVILLGSLVALRRTAWTFGSAPAGIDDDRALQAWVQIALDSLLER